MKSLSLILLMLLWHLTGICQSYSKGDKVEIFYIAKWYKGSILEVSGDKYKIHYDAYTSYWDEWVTKERIRPINGAASTTPTTTTNTPPPPVSNTKSSSKIGRLYFGMDGSLQSVYYYFLPDGRVIWGCPTGGLEYFNANASCTKDPSNCGTYSGSGNTLTVKWNNGETYTGTKNGNAINNINAANIVAVVQLQPKLSATYSSTYNSGGISAGQIYNFMNDESFTVQRASGYDNGDGKWSGESASNSKGSYKIEGFTLTLQYKNGKTTRHTIFGVGSSQNPDYLGFDESILDKRK